MSLPSPAAGRRPWPLPLRTAAGLAASVLAVHLWLLFAAPTTPTLAPGPITPVWHASLPEQAATAANHAPEGAVPTATAMPTSTTSLKSPTSTAAHTAPTAPATPTALAAASPPPVPAAPPPPRTEAMAALPEQANGKLLQAHAPAPSPLATDASAPTRPAGTAAAGDHAIAVHASHANLAHPSDTAPPHLLFAAAELGPDPDTTDRALLAQATALATAKVKVPEAVRLEYRIEGKTKGIGFSGKGHLLWQPGVGGDPNAYEAKLVVSHLLLGSRSQTSQGRLTRHGLAPVRFADKSRSEQAAHFVRDQGQIVFSANSPPVPLLPGAQDRLSVVLQISGLLAGNPKAYPAGRVLAIQTAGTKDAEVWQFKVVGDDTLDLPDGAMQALKLVRQPRHAYDQQIELWFAEKLAFLPVRIKWSQVGGNLVDQTWESSGSP